jgi:hypothetical protein
MQGRCFPRVDEGHMDRKTTSQWIHPVDSSSVGHRPLPSSGLECEPTLRLSRGETLILVLSLSLGLWALIWAAVSILGAFELR